MSSTQMTPTHLGVQNFPVFIPNLPRESPPVDFALHLEGVPPALLENLTSARRLALRALQDQGVAARAQNVEEAVNRYLAILAGLLDLPSSPSPAPAATPPAATPTEVVPPPSSEPATPAEEPVEQPRTETTEPSAEQTAQPDQPAEPSEQQPSEPSAEPSEEQPSPNEPAEQPSEQQPLPAEAAAPAPNPVPEQPEQESEPKPEPQAEPEPEPTPLPEQQQVPEPPSAPEAAAAAAPLQRTTPASVLSTAVSFAWSNFAEEKVTATSGGAAHEARQVVFSLGLWYLTAAKQASPPRDSLSDERSKEAFLSASKAAGAFAFVLPQTAASVLTDPSAAAASSALQQAFADIACAEAQAFVIASSERKRSPAIISSIARDTSDRYASALAGLQAVPNSNQRLLAFLDFKSTYFRGLSYYFQALDFTNADEVEAGKGIRAFQESLAHLRRSKSLFERFLSLPPKAPGQESQKYFEDLFKSVEAATEHITRLNDKIYFQIVPQLPESLPEPNSIAQPIPFTFPALNEEVWTPEVLASVKPILRPTSVPQVPSKRAGCCGGTKEDHLPAPALAPHFDRSARIVVVGAGPSGVHMTHLLRKHGYTNITLLEKSDSVGGKKLPFETGPLFLGTHDLRTRELVARFNSASELQPSQAGTGIHIVDPELQKKLGRDTNQALLNKDWALQLSVAKGGLLGRLFKALPMRLAAKRYARLHRQVFGEYESFVPPRLSPEALKSIDMPFGEWIERHNLGALRAIFLLNISFKGFGYLESIPTYYCLVWTKPEILNDLLLGGPLATPKEGFSQLWKSIAEKDSLNVHLETEVLKINRNLGSRAEPITVETVSQGVPKTFEADFLVLACPLNHAVNALLTDAVPDEIRLFSQPETTSLITSLVETSTFTTDKPAAVGYAHKLKPDGSMYRHCDSPQAQSAEGRRLVVTYQNYADYKAERGPEAEQKLMQELEELGWKDTKLVGQFIPEYFPRFSQHQITAGAPWDAREMQGKHRTWYVSAAVAMEGVEPILQNNCLMLKHFLGIDKAQDDPTK